MLIDRTKFLLMSWLLYQTCHGADEKTDELDLRRSDSLIATNTSITPELSRTLDLVDLFRAIDHAFQELTEQQARASLQLAKVRAQTALRRVSQSKSKKPD